ncbi:hypothetical protein M9H77_11853 [Catharanthus roseus]|uniref:Uncharacterized protein n=1 Tax=Catharanthus roseus TaxID=4058 RepID=A0ACC0BFS1_CATRO|nr:hypothetical protein M9H77_11853 [Catharanthus roseus]
MRMWEKARTNSTFGRGGVHNRQNNSRFTRNSSSRPKSSSSSKGMMNNAYAAQQIPEASWNSPSPLAAASSLAIAATQGGWQWIPGVVAPPALSSYQYVGAAVGDHLVPLFAPPPLQYQFDGTAIQFHLQ